MTIPPSPIPGNSEALEAPFVVELERLDETPNGSFRPHARLYLTSALRTSGLWQALPGEEMKTLLLMLTFLHPNGWCQPMVGQLAVAMAVSEGKARDRLARLAQRQWRGQPVVTEITRDNGLDAWAPAPTLIAIREAPPKEYAATPRAAGREAVVALSRERYAHPRAEVEQDIARRMGWEPPVPEDEDPRLTEERRRVYQQLQEIGLSRGEAQDVLDRFVLDRIARQVAWLPFRHAKSPVRFLLAAIENDYERPPALRHQELRDQELQHQEPRESLAPVVEAESRGGGEPQTTSETDAGELPPSEPPSPLQETPDAEASDVPPLQTDTDSGVDILTDRSREEAS